MTDITFLLWPSLPTPRRSPLYLSCRLKVLREYISVMYTTIFVSFYALFNPPVYEFYHQSLLLLQEQLKGLICTKMVISSLFHIGHQFL